MSQITVGSGGLLSDLAVAYDVAWFTRAGFRPGPGVIGVSLRSGAVVDSFAVLTNPECSLSAFGAPGALTVDPAGDVVFAGPFPGEFRIRKHGSLTTHDAHEFPAARGYATPRGTRRAPVSVRGVASDTSGGFIVGYSTSVVSDSANSPAQHHWLARISYYLCSETPIPLPACPAARTPRSEDVRGFDRQRVSAGIVTLTTICRRRIVVMITFASQRIMP